MMTLIPFSRRRFLKTIAGGAMLLSPQIALSAERYQRENARIKGVGLTTFSLRRHMKYWHGDPASGHLDILDFLEYCAENAIEAAELTSYFFKTPVEQEYLLEIRRRAHLLGIDLAAGAIGNNFSHPPGSERAKEQLEYAATWIDHFADLGIPVMRVFAGRPPSGISVDEAIENVVANVKEALAHAASRGVMLGMENHDFTTDVDHLLSIVGKIDSKWFGITFDSANLGRTSDPYADLARIAPYTISAQIKVMIPVDGEDQPADFEKIIRILKKAGYGGYLILEYEEEEDPFTAVPRYMDKIKQALKESR